MTAALGETEDSFRMAIYEYSVAIQDDTQCLCTPQRLRDCHDELIRHYRALSERLARVEGDAARYRFMRDNDLGDAAWNILCGHQGAELDEAVDEAIRAGK